MLSTMRRTTVVLPDPEPPATPITRRCGAGDTLVAYIRAIPILAARLLLGNDTRRKHDGEVRLREKSVIPRAVSSPTRFFIPPPAPVIRSVARLATIGASTALGPALSLPKRAVTRR